MLVAPEFEEAAVAECDVLGGVDAEARCGSVDPLGGAFQLGVVADWSFIDDAMAFAIGPLGTPFLVAEGGNEAEREKNFGHRIAVGDFGLGFDAVLVGVFAGTNVRQALVGDRPAAGITAYAQNLGAGAHLAVGRVVENVALEGARGLQREAGGLEALGEAGNIGESVEAEFDLGFDGHGQQ